jgi:hypothetical protein
MKDKGNYVEIDQLLDFGEGEDLVDTLLAEYDKLIATDIAAVLKKYYPYSTVDEEKVLKLARMLMADEKGGE